MPEIVCVIYCWLALCFPITIHVPQSLDIPFTVYVFTHAQSLLALSLSPRKLLRSCVRLTRNMSGSSPYLEKH